MKGHAVADTSLFIARETGRPLNAVPADVEVGVSMMTIAELELGVHTATTTVRRAQRLRTLRDAERLTALPFDREVAHAFSTLVADMRHDGKARLSIQDAIIAATAIAHEADLLTQDADFDDIPYLDVVRL